MLFFFTQFNISRSVCWLTNGPLINSFQYVLLTTQVIPQTTATKSSRNVGISQQQGLLTGYIPDKICFYNQNHLQI